MSDYTVATPFTGSAGGQLSQPPDLQTAFFRASLSTQLRNISPSLAAFHTSRNRLLGNSPYEPNPLTCARCGATPCSTRLTSSNEEKAAGRKGNRATVIKSRCPACRVNNVRNVEQRGGASKKKGHPMVRLQAIKSPEYQIGPTKPMDAKSEPILPAPSKPSQPPQEAENRKKKSTSADNFFMRRPTAQPREKQGLEKMLAQHRKRQEKKPEPPGTGLAGFLLSLSEDN